MRGEELEVALRVLEEEEDLVELAAELLFKIVEVVGEVEDVGVGDFLADFVALDEGFELLVVGYVDFAEDDALVGVSLMLEDLAFVEFWDRERGYRCCRGGWP